MVIPGVIGGVAGAYFLASIPGKTIKPFIAALLLIMGILVLYRFATGKIPSPSGEGETSLAKLLVLGFMAAFMDAVGGGGWGPIATPGLILTGDHEAPKVVGSVNMVEFFVTIAEALTFLLVLGPEQFRWDIVGALLIGGVVAAPLAAFLCKRLPHRMLGILIGIALIGFNLRTLVLTFLR